MMIGERAAGVGPDEFIFYYGKRAHITRAAVVAVAVKAVDLVRKFIALNNCLPSAPGIFGRWRRAKDRHPEEGREVC